MPPESLFPDPSAVVPRNARGRPTRPGTPVASWAISLCLAVAAAFHSAHAQAQAAIPALGIPAAAAAVAFIARTDYPGKVAAGKEIARTRCMACHGLDGLTAGFPEYPRLAGQLQGYLYLQLVFFSNGERQHPVMSTQVLGLTNAQLHDVAAYFASLQDMPPLPPQVPADQLALGERLFRKGALERGVPACASCHGPSGRGQLPAFARIGGQHPQYMRGMLTLFREKNEFTTPYAWVMNSVAAKLTAAEISAVTAYASTLK